MDDGRSHNGSTKVARYVKIVASSPLLLNTENFNRKVNHPTDEPSGPGPHKPSGLADPGRDSTQTTTIIEDFVYQDGGDELQSSDADDEDGEDQLEYSSGDTGGSLVRPSILTTFFCPASNKYLTNLGQHPSNTRSRRRLKPGH